MPELKVYVPSYNHGEFRTAEPPDDLPEFGDPRVPVIVREADGIRIVLGSHDYWDVSVPDVQIERRPGGWAVFLHPVGASDPSGYVYFLDNGSSYVVPEHGLGPTPPLMLLRDVDVLRHLDEPNSDAVRPTLKPCEICEARPEDQMDDWSGLCPRCEDFVNRYIEFKSVPFAQRDAVIAFLKLRPDPRPPIRATSATSSRRTRR